MVVCFYCYHSGVGEKFWAQIERSSGELKKVRVDCTGKLDILSLLKPFEDGADKVIVLGCPNEECHNLTGSYKAKKRIQYIQQVLEDIGLGKEQIEFITVPRWVGVNA